MKVKIILTFLGIILAVTAVLYGIYLKEQSRVEVVSSVSQIQPTPTPVEELAVWVDQSEFSFQYPKSLKLDPHDEDQKNYAHVELTSATYSGNLIVWAKDTSAEDIETWVEKTKAQGTIDSILGGEKAKKILINEESKKLTTSTIHDGYLYQIEVNLADTDFWNRIYEIVSSSFKFISPQNETTEKNREDQFSVSEEVGEGEIIEEEEVIE